MQFRARQLCPPGGTIALLLSSASLYRTQAVAACPPAPIAALRGRGAVVVATCSSLEVTNPKVESLSGSKVPLSEYLGTRVSRSAEWGSRPFPPSRQREGMLSILLRRGRGRPSDGRGDCQKRGGSVGRRPGVAVPARGTFVFSGELSVPERVFGGDCPRSADAIFGRMFVRRKLDFRHVRHLLERQGRGEDGIGRDVRFLGARF